jgi:crotonobetainyl-CoA:carnitine CoA-transferase CaiB-like acyl-CoA transferase
VTERLGIDYTTLRRINPNLYPIDFANLKAEFTARQIPINESATAAEALMADELSSRAARERSDGEGDCCRCQDKSRAERPRRRTHENLASAMRLSFTRSLRSDDPEVLKVNHHLKRWLGRSGPYLLGVVTAEIVNVGFDSTLVMSPTVHVFHAKKIYLSSGSRLRFEGGPSA